MPRLQDHYVACSYINERKIYSIISRANVIFGFDTLECGSILGMGDSDIDSIGIYSKSYDRLRELQGLNKHRARYFVPSELLRSGKKDGYNEIIIERRNLDKSRHEEFKRKPDYIIMVIDSIEKDNFNYPKALYQNQLSFISEQDKKEIQQIGNYEELIEF